MELDIIKLQTTWNDAAGSINSNYAKIADAIAQLKANGGGGGISELTSKMVVDALGYTPYNATNPANYITSDALSPYAKTADVSTTYATIASIQGFENRIGGLEGAVPQLNERVSIVEGEVSTLNEIVSTGKNNLLDRVNTIETDYVTSGDLESAINGIDLSVYLLKADLTTSRIQSTLGISDWALAATKPSYTAAEVGALSLGGGTVTGEFTVNGQPMVTKAGNATIIFSPNNREQNYWFGVDTYGTLFITDNGYNKIRAIIHEDNIGNYKAGDAGNSDKLGWVEASKYFKGDTTNLISNINADNLVNNACYLNQTGNGSGNANFPHTYSIFNVFTNGSDSRVAQISISNDGLAIRRKIDSWGEWRHYINTANIGNYNAGSADILATSFGENINYTSGESSLKLVRYVSDWESNGFPVNYSAGLSVMTNYTGWQLLSYGGDNENPYFRSVKDDGVWKAWRQIAFLTDNVASATKLKTRHKLWGNDFDGTADVNGSLDVSGNIKASGDITANKFIGSIRGNITYDNGTDEGHFIGLGSDGVGVKGLLNYVYGNFPILFYTNGFERMRIGEYVGIGTTSPTERLDVSGNIKASGNINATSVTIGGVTLSWDSVNNALVVNGNMYGTGSITAKKSA